MKFINLAKTKKATDMEMYKIDNKYFDLLNVEHFEVHIGRS